MRNKISPHVTVNRFGIPLILLVFNIALALDLTPKVAKAMAIDCVAQRSSENYIGVKYKAVLVEDNLPGTQWALLFGGSRFTYNGEYNVPHLLDLMIKASWADVYNDPLTYGGRFSQPVTTLDNFTIEFGLSDYEDPIQDNDIGIWSQDPQLFPRKFVNIDSSDPKAPDKIMAEYQVNRGGLLEGREIEVSLVRGEQTRLARDINYFVDPDLPDTPSNSLADILYRRWTATLKVSSLGVDSSVDFYVNASQGDKILGAEALNFLWENPGRPVIETDRFKVFIFDPQVKMESGEWKKVTKFLLDYRTPRNELPLNQQGHLVGGFRKANYGGVPAIEASFGYGYTDYVLDGDPTNYEPTDATKGVIDLTFAPPIVTTDNAPASTPAPTSVPAPTPMPTPTPTEALPVQPPTNWWLIGGIIAGCIVVAAGLLVYFFVWRKRRAPRPS